MLTRRTLLTASLAAPALVLAGRPVLAATPYVYSEDGIAIDGSDAVAYFAGEGPVAGSPDHALTWEGAEWRFANAANREAFEMNPRAYAPQFGGYCAYAVSQGYTAPTVPEAWSIVDGKLYLNFSLRVRGIWEQDIPGHIAAAEANWPGVLA